MNIEIANAYLITVDNENHVYRNGTVQIVGNMIAYAGSQEGKPDFKADRVIDAMGDIVMPGFYNTHTHLPMVLMRGFGEDMALGDWLTKKIFPVEAKLDGELVYIGTMMALIEMIKNGVVAISDMYFFMDQVVRAMKECGIKGLVSRGLTGQSMEGMEPALKETEDLFDMLDMQGGIRPAYCIHAEYTCCHDLISYVAERAKARGARIHAHISETKSEHDESKQRNNGRTPIRLFADLGALDPILLAAHCVYVDDEDRKLMVKNHVQVLHCPASNLKLASGVAPVQELLDAGINVSLGTDGAASNNSLSVMYEMRLASMLQKGINHDPTLMPLDQTIRMATKSGADALGFNDSGSLEKGNRADLIMIHTQSTAYHPRENLKTHLIYCAEASDVRMTMIDGKILYEDGKISFADEELIIRDFEKSLKRLFG